MKLMGPGLPPRRHCTLTMTKDEGKQSEETGVDLGEYFVVDEKGEELFRSTDEVETVQWALDYLNGRKTCHEYG